MKIVSLSELDTVDATHDCFIVKRVFDESKCRRLVADLGAFLRQTADNERLRGENWHYRAIKEGIEFDSFLFQDVRQFGNALLMHFYERLFELYGALGESFPIERFEHQIGPIDAANVKTINPAVLWYPAGVGKFAAHRHPDEHQKFQLLANLTQPGLDYRGGETVVELTEDHTERFDDRFERGDVLGFPYSRWHSVNAVLPGTSELKARVSLLMPLHPRRGIKTYYAQQNRG
jgi:hypothetical protein